MTKERLFDLIKHRHEIELVYKKKEYSITYGISNGEHVISFCEFDKDTIEFKKIDELWNGVYHDIKISEIILSLSEDDVWIY